jgi:hypothetical protein
MTSLLRNFLATFDHPATVENPGVAPEPAPSVDLDSFDSHLEERFDEGKRELAEAAASGGQSSD